MQKITPEEFIVTDWAGGKTEEIAIFPKGKIYGDRDFDFRISSATVEGEESKFTALPDYNRFLAVLTGEVRLLNETAKEKFKLTPYKIYAFDGGDSIISHGQCRDFNLMVKKDSCCGSMTTTRLSREAQVLSFKSNETVLIFCGEGKITLEMEGDKLPLLALESAIIKGGNEIIVSSQEDAWVILCRMWQKVS
ncbi:MAG: HutD family protein [Oscillospiraceae bacterium]